MGDSHFILFLFFYKNRMVETRVELPESFDFETYINNYEGKYCLFLFVQSSLIEKLHLGYARIARSLFIAKHCDALAIEAYKTAIKEIKENTLNTSKYTVTVDCLNAALHSQGQPAYAIDQDWISNVQNINKTTIDQLENELRSAKSALSKEAIRVISANSFYE